MTSNPHAWNLSDLKAVKQNGVKVMSTFSCGGGSSMGYKRAGCDVIAANDIDPVMELHYKKNLNPEHYFLCPIKDLVTKDLPPELFDLDILDGSPPCSTFSMSGSREKDWGKEKHFREGQAKQVLSDLFFDYLDLVDRLKPRVAIAENVKGMLIGNAKGYTKLVMERFKEIGYRPQVFLVNAADCGVPQKRERVFFCAVRNDISTEKLVLNNSKKWVSILESTDDLLLSDEQKLKYKLSEKALHLWSETVQGSCFEKAYIKLTGKKLGYFTHFREAADQPSNTIVSGSSKYHFNEPRLFSIEEYVRLGSFPDDYSFNSHSIGKYMIGMSVPPKMTEQIARAVCSQWLGVKYE